MVIWLSWLSGSLRYFLCSSSVYSCHFFLISSASVRSIPFLSFIETISAWNVPLVCLIFLKRSLGFPFYCFPLFLCTDHWGRLSYFSLLFFWTLHSNGLFLPFSALLFTSLLFIAICKTCSDSHFTFLHFFFLGMALIPVSFTMSWTSDHSSSGTVYQI